MRRLAALAALAVILLALGAARMPAARASAGHSRTYVAWHWALAHRGSPYVYGATGPQGFDCSGLVWASYRAAGITLPRTTYAMLASRMLVRTWQPTPGVLAFYGSGHVELYDGPGQTFGAHDSGTTVGPIRFSASWRPSAYYRVAGAG